MALLQNQFGQSPVKGMLDLRFNTGIIACEIDTSETGELVAGQAVTIVDSAGGVPKVVAATADTDEVFGFIVYNIKNQKFVAGDAVEIAALFSQNVMYMEASAAIARGAKTMIVVSGSKVATATAGKPISGYALDKAATSGDLIRVVIICPAAFLA